MTTEWYALRSKPNKERVLWVQVKARQIEVYFPRLKVKPVNPRSAKVRAFFPGYMFVRVDLEELGRTTFEWMPFAQGLIEFGGEPAPVPGTLIAGVQRRLKEFEDAGGIQFDGLSSGVPVRITDGPFAGHEAIFDARISGSDRVRVLLEFITARQVSVNMDVGHLQRINRN